MGGGSLNLMEPKRRGYQSSALVRAIPVFVNDKQIKYIIKQISPLHDKHFKL